MTSARRLSLLLSAAALAATLTPALFSQSGPYKILSTTKLGGDGGWDYLAADASSRQLFIARTGPTGNLHVYNLDTLAPLGEVPTGPAHGAAIDDSLHHGFATSNPVTMFDTQTLKVIKTINTGGRPDGYLADPATHRVYILSHVTPNVTVLDANTGDILKAFDAGGAVEQSVLDNHGHLFIDLEDKDAIAVIDTATLTVTGKYDLSKVSGGCAGLAIDKEHDVLFAACDDKKNMVILSATDGTIITTLPIGDGCDGAQYNPATQEVFSTQGDGTLTVIKSRLTPRSEPTATDFFVEQTVTTQPRARTLTLDLKTGHIITATADFGPAPAAEPGKRVRPPMIPGTFRVLVIGK
jgi:DNA-binding beta-propeller fold protein YncE